MSEDLPNPESRVTLDGAGRSGSTGSAATGPRISALVQRCASGCARRAIRSCCRSLSIAARPRINAAPCASAPIPRRAPLDPYCRAWDHPNLFVVDASFLPTSAAVNPSLTIAAQALRVADHIARNDLQDLGAADRWPMTTSSSAAGSAGCVLANRLSADPSINVLLLEAGGGDCESAVQDAGRLRQDDQGRRELGLEHRPAEASRTAASSGTPRPRSSAAARRSTPSSTRAATPGITTPGSSEAGCEGWSYREVLPYFKRSEDNQRLVNAYHSYGGPLGVSYPVNPPPISFAFLRAAQEAGIPFNDDFNGAVQDGIGHYQLSTRNAERSSTSSAFLKPVARPQAISPSASTRRR